jgi:drug/metabolite transporter (DMT)-like permease
MTMMWTRILILLVAVNAVIGQLILKRAVLGLGAAPKLENIPRFLLAASKSPWIYASVAIQALGYVLWMILVSRAKLSVATASVAAVFYILVALASWWIYGESLNNVQWLGIGLITIGVVCVSAGRV